MKKLIGFLTLALFYGCACIGQLGTQFLYVDENCEGFLPDYRLVINVRDNCGIDTVIQVPEAGLKMDFTNPEVNVGIIATDVFDNTSSIYFDVVLLDTIPPWFYINDSLIGEVNVMPKSTGSADRRAQPEIMPENGIIYSITMFHNGAEGNLLYGIYSDFDNKPYKLLGKTGITAKNDFEGRQTAHLISPVYISESTKFWLSYVYSGTVSFRYDDGGIRAQAVGSYFSDGMPEYYSEGTSDVSMNAFHYSIYANYSPLAKRGYTDDMIVDMFKIVEGYINNNIQDYVDNFDWSTANIGKILQYPNAICKPMN